MVLIFLLMWCITFIDVCMLGHLCIPVINPTWSWYIVLLMGSRHRWKWGIEDSNCCMIVITSFRSFSICFLYLGSMMLTAYVFINVTSSWWIDPYVMTFFVSCCHFWLKVCLSDVITAFPALSLLLFEWNTFFHPCTLSLCVSLKLKFGLDGSLFWGCDVRRKKNRNENVFSAYSATSATSISFSH